MPGGATGLSMIVPPGHPNDTFLLRASSGERVDIVPFGANGTMQQVISNYFTLYFPDEGSTALGMATVRQISRGRLNASMGR